MTKFKIGDRVMGFAEVMKDSNIDHGAWQTYTLVREHATIKIPQYMSYNEGSVFPMQYATAASCLVDKLGVPRPTGSTKSQQQFGLLVWGGASAVGTAIIQVAKNLGFQTFVTASSKHHDYLKSLGASATFDYHDDDVVSNVVSSAKDHDVKIGLGVDCVSEGTTSISSAEILLASGGRVARLFS